MSVRVTTFDTLDEAFSKLSTGGLEFDVIFSTPDQLSRLVGRELVERWYGAFGGQLHDRKPARAQDLLVDRLDQRLGGGPALDDADITLLHGRRVVHEDARECVGALVPHAAVLVRWAATVSSSQR